MSSDQAQPVRTPLQRCRALVLTAIGCLLVGVGVVGLIVPLLPTTPFLLLASACFLRGSARCRRWLLHSPLFGPMIHEWQETRTISPRARLTAIALIVLIIGSTVIVLGCNLLD